MADYLLSHLSLSTRFELAACMFYPVRPSGMVSELSREHGVSRKFLYELQEKARVSILGALQPGEPGRRANSSQLEIDAHFVRRAIAVCMSVVPGTVRTVQSLLELLLGVQRSTGYISQIAQEIGAGARAYQQSLRLPIPVLGEADEIFQGHKPCLTLVDGRFFLVLSLSAQEHRDKTTLRLRSGQALGLSAFGCFQTRGPLGRCGQQWCVGDPGGCAGSFPFDPAAS